MTSLPLEVHTEQETVTIFLNSMLDILFSGNSYFPYIVTEWNYLDKSIRNPESFSLFKKNILKFVPLSPNSIFNCHNPKGVKLLTRLRLGLSHLHNHKFKHSFQDSLNLICNCGTESYFTTAFTSLFFLMKG